MNFFVGLVIWVLFGVVASTGSVLDRKRISVCYFGSWAKYRPGNGNFNIDNINADLCDICIYSFLTFDWNLNIKLNDLPDDAHKLTELRRKNPTIKILLAIGGWNEGSLRFSKVVESEESRQKCIRNLVTVVNNFNADGVDLDWEYPAQRGGAPADKENFIAFIKELKQEFKPRGLLLTAAVGGPAYHIPISYDVPAMDKHLDYINIMSYDLHGPWDGTTGQNAPLRPNSRKPDFSVQQCVKAWIDAGASRKKILVGIGFYGRSFTLQDAKRTALASPIAGPGVAGEYTREPGLLSYLEICEARRSGGWIYSYDEEQEVPFIHKKGQWVGYDDVRSVKAKADWVIKEKLAGCMFWSIDYEDTNNNCGFGVCPLLSAIDEAFRNADALETTTSEPTTTTTTTPQPTTTTTPKPTTTTTPKPTTTTTTTPKPTTTTTPEPTTTTTPKPTTTTTTTPKPTTTTTPEPTTTTTPKPTTTTTTTPKPTTTTTPEPTTTTTPETTTTTTPEPTTTTTPEPTTTTTTTPKPTTTTTPKPTTTTTTTPQPTTTTTPQPTTTTAKPSPPPNSDNNERLTIDEAKFECSRRDPAKPFCDPPNACTPNYIICMRHFEGFLFHKLNCANRLVYDSITGTCNYRYKTTACKSNNPQFHRLQNNP